MTRRAIIVCGSRDWTDTDAIHRVMRKLTDRGDTPLRKIRLVVIHGAAKGADEIAASFAGGMGAAVIAMPALWRTH